MFLLDLRMAQANQTSIRLRDSSTETDFQRVPDMYKKGGCYLVCEVRNLEIFLD